MNKAHQVITQRTEFKELPLRVPIAANRPLCRLPHAGIAPCIARTATRVEREAPGRGVIVGITAKEPRHSDLS